MMNPYIFDRNCLLIFLLTKTDLLYDISLRVMIMIGNSFLFSSSEYEVLKGNEQSNKKLSVFRVTSLKTLGRVGTHNFIIRFSHKVY